LEHLRSVGNTIYQTFQQAAAALGLFQNATEAHYALTDGTNNFASPHQLRFLLCQLLLNFPANAINLFDHFQEQLMADYLDQFSSAGIAADFSFSLFVILRDS